MATTIFKKGISKNEIDAAKHELFKKYPDRFGVYKIMSRDEILTDQELMARDHILSCITYGEDYNWYNVRTGELGRSAKPYLEYFDEDYLIELFKQQKEAFQTRATWKMSNYDKDEFNYREVIWDDVPVDFKL